MEEEELIKMCVELVIAWQLKFNLTGHPLETLVE